MSAILMAPWMSAGKRLFEFNVAGEDNLNLRNMALAAGWNGTDAVQAMVASVLGPKSVKGSFAIPVTDPTLIIDGAWPKGVTLIVNANIYGRGGAGGNVGQVGYDGCTAILVSTPCSIENNAKIYGGGGGGGGDGTGVVNGKQGGGGARYGPGNPSATTSANRGGGASGAAGSRGLQGSAGGAAGYFVDGNAYVTWITPGLLYGRYR